MQSYGLWILIFIPYHLSRLWVELISVQFSGWGKYFVQIWLRPPTSYLNASLSLAFPMPLATSRLKSTEYAVMPFNRWMTIPKFWPKRYRYFFSWTKFSETETNTFFRDQIFGNQNRDFLPETKFSQTDTETLQKLAKVSRPRPKPRLLNILDNFWRDLLQIFSSFSFPVFLLLQRKDILLLRIFSLFFFPSGMERPCQRSSLCFLPYKRWERKKSEFK